MEKHAMQSVGSVPKSKHQLLVGSQKPKGNPRLVKKPFLNLPKIEYFVKKWIAWLGVEELWDSSAHSVIEVQLLFRSF